MSGSITSRSYPKGPNVEVVDHRGFRLTVLFDVVPSAPLITRSVAITLRVMSGSIPSRSYPKGDNIESLIIMASG